MSAGLEVEALCATLGGARLVDEVSLRVQPGRIHALVGESGSGKSMTALAITGLVPEGVARTGRVLLGGVDVLPLSSARMRAHLGRDISLMLQEPLAALNPVMRVDAHVIEALRVHHAMSLPRARGRAAELLAEVGLTEARVRAAYPHQLSGGMRQRVLLAAALAGEPKVLIADEPTTALDASVRGVVLALLRSLTTARQLAVLLLTHDLGIVRHACDEVSVMYAGRIVEQGTSVLENPRHPYTCALLAALPANGRRGAPLEVLEGTVPGPNEVIEGCRFRPRCPRADSACHVRPALEEGVACHHPKAAP